MKSENALPLGIMDRINQYKATTIYVDPANNNATDSPFCGTLVLPCTTITAGAPHVIIGPSSVLSVTSGSPVNSETDIRQFTIQSRLETSVAVPVSIPPNSTNTRTYFISTEGIVDIQRIRFLLEGAFEGYETLLHLNASTTLVLENDTFSTQPSTPSVLLSCALLSLSPTSSLTLLRCFITSLTLSTSSLIAFPSHSSFSSSINAGSDALFSVNFTSCTVTKISQSSTLPAILNSPSSAIIHLTDTTFTSIDSLKQEGSIAVFKGVTIVNYCSFHGLSSLYNSQSEFQSESQSYEEEPSLCSWNGSLVCITDDSASATLLETTFEYAPDGALAVTDGATVHISKGCFMNNNPSFHNYPSIRRNILCISRQSKATTLEIVSLTAGDGATTNSSLWIQSDASCQLRSRWLKFKIKLFV